MTFIDESVWLVEKGKGLKVKVEGVFISCWLVVFGYW